MRNEQFKIKISAKAGEVLAGGITENESSPFDTREDALNWLYAVKPYSTGKIGRVTIAKKIAGMSWTIDADCFEDCKDVYCEHLKPKKTDDAGRRLKWTLGRNNERRVEPVGDIWFTIVLPAEPGGDNPTCPQCGRNNAMMPEFGVNNLVYCRDCMFLCKAIDTAEHEENREKRLKQLVARKDKALQIVRDAMPADVSPVVLNRVIDVLLTNQAAEENFDRYMRTVRKIDQEFA